ncbi:MAG: DUF4329 domain-containing protein [Clostridiales bacterium]|nr:DUF4329 domain-containing protein [Clostridiales bacterium]
MGDPGVTEAKGSGEVPIPEEDKSEGKQDPNQEGAFVFSSEEDAVKAFGDKYAPLSKTERQEYGAVIEKNADGKYAYTNVMNSTKTAEMRGLTINPASADKDPLRNSVSIKYTSNSVADVHTHWRSDGNLNFSNPSDYSSKVPVDRMYLVNRNSEIYYSQRTTEAGNINGFSPGIKK